MVMKAKPRILKILVKVQYNKTCHRKQLENLKEIYNESREDNFFKDFVSLLKIPLSMGDNHIHITNVMEFAAKFAVSLTSQDGECPFLNKLFSFLIQHHDAKNFNVRYRICMFLSLLLNSMGENAIIEDDLYDFITTAMIERMHDRSYKVRVQAVTALQRLQDPTDENCPVIEVYLFHLNKDPNPEVRKTILQVIGKNKKVLAAALKRIYDNNMLVRKATYILISKITVRSLTIDQREIILKNGLKDRSEIVRECVRNVLLPSWLRYYSNDYIGLLKGLDAENALDISILSLNTLIKNDKSSLKELTKQIDLDETTRLIPIDKVSSENVLFWRCLTEYLRQESRMEELEEIIPELTPFCTYIREYLTFMKAKRYELWEEKSHEFVLYQLFEMAKKYDLSDESGKNYLKQLILDTLITTLLSERIIKSIVEHLEKVIPEEDNRISVLIEIIGELRMPIKQQTQQIIPVVRTDKERHEIKMQIARLRVQLSELEEDLYNVIQNKEYLKAEELRKEIESLRIKMNELLKEPTEMVTIDEVCEEKNDPETLMSCLRIMCFMMQSPEMTTLTPNLRTVMDNLALGNINHPNKGVRKLAIICLGLCCLMDKQLAKQHIFATFLVQFSLEQECPEICSEALKIILDLLCCYGLHYFDIFFNEEDESAVAEQSRRNRTVRLYTNLDDSISGTTVDEPEPVDGSRIMKFLIDLMESSNKECRRISILGLIKLLMLEKISSCRLVSRLIIHLHNPERRSDTYILQYIIDFLNYLAKEIPNGQQILENVFFMTLRTLENSLESTAYVDINQCKVAKLILILTSSKYQKSGYSSVHNNLVHNILNEMMNVNCNLDVEVLAKSLVHLNLNIETEHMQKELLETTDKVIETLKRNHSHLVKLVHQFRKQLEMHKINVEIEGNEEQRSNTEIEIFN